VDALRGAGPKAGGAGNGAPIRAAGGVVWRDGPAGTREVAIVHRPRHDDWTLPKGKLEYGEPPLRAAVREVWEETGLRPRVGARLPTVHYDVWAGNGLVEKVVDYWAMSLTGDDGFVPGRETDVRVWLGLDQAMRRLTYAHDVKVVGAFSELPRLRDPIVLVRHASAGSRIKDEVSDRRRPLDRKGTAQAEDLAKTLRCFGPARLVSAGPRRCVDTLAPLAAELGLSIEVDVAFDEDGDPKRAAARLVALSEGCQPVVVCSQRGLIPASLAAIAGGSPSTYRTPKGSGWVLSFAEQALAALDELPLS
jgi:8-oxo-dGTP pyrophosphatase MutT (NUDIX family)/phosphohistidine phosphatase SixA